MLIKEEHFVVVVTLVAVTIMTIVGAFFIFSLGMQRMRIQQSSATETQEIKGLKPPCIKYTLSDGKTKGEILNVERAIYAKDRDCYIIYADGNIYVLCNCSIIFYDVIPTVQYHSPVIEY